MKMPFQLIRRKIVLKTLLIQKAVVTLLIRSFFNNGGLFANCTYTISCYIIAVQEVVAVKEQKYYLYLSDDEYRQTRLRWQWRSDRRCALSVRLKNDKVLSLVTAFLLPGNTGVVLCGRPDEMLRLRQIQNAFHEGIKFRFG